MKDIGQQYFVLSEQRPSCPWLSKYLNFFNWKVDTELWLFDSPLAEDGGDMLYFWLLAQRQSYPYLSKVWLHFSEFCSTRWGERLSWNFNLLIVRIVLVGVIMNGGDTYSYLLCWRRSLMEALLGAWVGCQDQCIILVKKRHGMSTQCLNTGSARLGTLCSWQWEHTIYLNDIWMMGNYMSGRFDWHLQLS